jgi:hypothetical protein
MINNKYCGNLFVKKLPEYKLKFSDPIINNAISFIIKIRIFNLETNNLIFDVIIK